MSETETSATARRDGAGGTRLSTWFMLVALGLVLLMSAVYVPLDYIELKRVTLEGIDKKLLMAADMARESLPADYHDRITDAASVGEEEYLKIVENYDRLCLEHGLEYVWSLIEIDGVIRFSSSTSRDKRAHENHAAFFEQHTNPQAYARAFQTMEVQHTDIADKWGELRTVLAPGVDSSGRKFLFGASMRLDNVNDMLRRHLLTGVICGLLICLVGVGLALFLSKRISRSAAEMTKSAQALLSGRFDQTAPVTGAYEMRVLAVCFNRMSAALAQQMDALRDSEARYRVTVEQTGQLVYDYDPASGRILWQGAIEAMTGYTPEEYAETDIVRWEELVHPDDRQDMLETLKRSEESCGRFDVTYRLRHKSGSYIHVEEHGVFLPDERGVAVRMLGTIIDVSGRAAAEAEKEKLEAQLRQSQKLEAIGQLAGGVAHDFNNILTAILGNVELSMDELRLESTPKTSLIDSLRQIERSAERASALTRQLLAFSRRQVSQPEVLDLNAVLASLKKLLTRLITENIAIDSVADPALKSIKADAGQIEQVIVNLVVNAVDAMPDGGKLTLETQNVVLDDNYVRSNAEGRPGAHVLLAVSDSGHGMDARTREHIFEPFFTTKPVDKGTGLGLSTVHGIVKQAGGHIMVYSEPGSGTTFRVYLPAVDEAPGAHPLESTSDQRLEGEETILLCEDDNSVRELTTMLLKFAGYTVIAASGGKQAIEKNAAEKGRIDLLITDVVMTDMNGRELSDAIQAARPGLPTLYVSGYTANVIAHHGVLDKGVEFLEKPFTRTLLLRRVRKVLEKAKLGRQPL